MLVLPSMPCTRAVYLVADHMASIARRTSRHSSLRNVLHSSLHFFTNGYIGTDFTSPHAATYNTFDNNTVNPSHFSTRINGPPFTFHSRLSFLFFLLFHIHQLLAHSTQAINYHFK